MKRLVVFPSDPIEAYIKQGKSYDYLEGYFNPGGYFDEVYCLTLWEKENKKIGKIAYLKCEPLKLQSLINDIHPDVIRAYGGYVSSDLAQLSRIDDVPIVVSIHDTNPNLIYPSVKKADYIVCMAQCVKNAVTSKLAINDDNITVMPNRIDSTLFSRRIDAEYFGLLNAKFGKGKHILHVGRKTKQKNLDTLIRSLCYLDGDVSVIFVGSGDDDEYRHIAQEMKVGDRCFWVPSVKKEELPLWYSWCDCFCTPSRWEGFGFVFIEAAGCEAPIVTSNIAPMNEYLTDEVNALLVDEYENPEKLAKTIEKVILGGSQIKEMCREARKVGLNFDKAKIDRQEIDIYKFAIENGSRRNEMTKLEWLKLHWKYRRYNYRGYNNAI